MVGVTAVGSWSGIFLFRQKTAYEMRISDWSSDVCSSDLGARKRGDWDHVEVRRAVGARAARDEAAAVEQHERALDAEAAKVDLRGAIAVVRPIGRGLVAGEARIGREPLQHRLDVDEPGVLDLLGRYDRCRTDADRKGTRRNSRH